MRDEFYKTFNERTIAKVVDTYYNDEIGGRENHYYDTDEMLPITEEDLIAYVVNSIMATKKVLYTEAGYGIEAKHIRFMGKQRVTEIVTHRIQQRHQKEGKWIWEK